jgi:hemoglobin
MTRERSTRLPLAVLAAVVALVPAPPAGAGDAPRAASAPSSLYGRLGGYDFIARFVDTAFPRVGSHPQLRRLFQGHARDSQARQRQLIVDALCQATGGPCLYTGRGMKAVHTGLAITAEDWTVFKGILGGALDELKAAPAERQDFLRLIEERFRPDVVEER